MKSKKPRLDDELVRVTLGALLHKLGGFAPTPREAVHRGDMGDAVYRELQRLRGELVPADKLRGLIRPNRLEDRFAGRASSLKTLQVAVLFARRRHPDERIRNVFGEGYVLEKKDDRRGPRHL